MSIRIQGSTITIQYSAGTLSTQAPSAAPPVMPTPTDALAASGDVGAMIAALLLESGKAARETAKLAKDAAAAAEDSAHARRLDAMETAADRKLVAGVAVGVGEIGQGALGIAGAAKQDAKLDGAGLIAKGGGGVTKAAFENFASSNDREVAQAERAMTQAKRNVESAGDMDKDAKDLVRRAMSHYADYVRAKDDASKGALFRA